MIKFKPPTYGNYTYPPWGVAIGWTLALCSMILIPANIVFSMARTDGTLSEVKI